MRGRGHLHSLLLRCSISDEALQVGGAEKEQEEEGRALMHVLTVGKEKLSSDHIFGFAWLFCSVAHEIWIRRYKQTDRDQEGDIGRDGSVERGATGSCWSGRREANVGWRRWWWLLREIA